MKKQRLYSYLTVAVLVGFWSCTSSRQTAQNTGDADDLYGNYGGAPVYASNGQDNTYSNQPYSRSPRLSRQQRAQRNANPDYNDEQYNANGGDTNSDEYYSELSTRKLNRGLSPDPGWNDTGTNAYNSGFVNGYNSATASAYSWNRWGYNNTGFYSGLGLGYGLGSYGFGYPGVSFGFGSPFYSPFGYGSAFAYSPFYSPFGYGGFYDPFYSPFYSPFGYGYGGLYGYGYGGYYGGSVAYVNNAYVAGADPYRSGRTYGPTGGASGRYNDAFVNSARSNNGARSGAYNSVGSANNATVRSGNAGNNNVYYAAPRSNNRGSYYYDNSSSASPNSRSGANVAGSATNSAPSYNSSNGYYSSPRQQSRGGSYAPANSGFANGSQPNFNQPSYQNQSRSYSQPNFSQPSHTFSQPSFGGARSGGFSSGGGGGFSGGGGHMGGGGGRGPR